MAEIFRAREAFSYNDESGVPVVVTPGKLVSSDDPGYKGRESFFEPLEDRLRTEKAVRSGRGVEDATAEPNAKRSVSTAKSTASKQKSASDTKSVSDTKPETKPTGGIKTTSFPGHGGHGATPKGDAK